MLETQHHMVAEEAAAVKKRMYEMTVKADKTYEGIRNHLLRVL